MIYVNSFLFCGIVCLIAQIIMDNTNLTPGHLTSLFTVLGSLLAVFGIYDTIIELYYNSLKDYYELNNYYCN